MPRGLERWSLTVRRAYLRADLKRLIEALRSEPDAQSLLGRLSEALETPRTSPRDLRIKLLGGLSILVGDRWESGPPPMRGRRLIEYPALNRNVVVSRDRLVELLDPRLEGEDATHRLHIAVSGGRAYPRRALLGVDAIRCVRGGYSWSPDVTVVTDVAEFLEAGMRRPGRSPSRAFALFRRATERRRG